MAHLLMPKATAVWLIDNTALTFDQIADFCGLHPLEVKGIADGDVAHGIKGMDPINTGQLTRSELERCQQDSSARLELAESKRNLPEPKKQKGSAYMPLSKRQERPNAIYWLVRNHPELNDAQVSRLVGTTKPTIQAIRNRTHWNISNLKPVDPVTLQLCRQIELDREVTRAAKRVERANKRAAQKAKSEDMTLMPAESSALSDSATPQPQAGIGDAAPVDDSFSAGGGVPPDGGFPPGGGVPPGGDVPPGGGVPSGGDDTIPAADTSGSTADDIPDVDSIFSKFKSTENTDSGENTDSED